MSVLMPVTYIILIEHHTDAVFQTQDLPQIIVQLYTRQKQGKGDKLLFNYCTY